MPVPKSFVKLAPVILASGILYETGFLYAQPSWKIKEQEKKNQQAYESMIYTKAGLKDPHKPASAHH